MTKRTALDLIRTLARDEATLHGQEFVAPLQQGGRARLRIRGLIHEFAVQQAQPGWWRCRVLNSQQATIVDAAQPWQRGDYLALWPVLRLVLLEPLKHHAWLALPYNPSDAFQRFGLAGPVAVQLVENGQPFERVLGRVEGGAVWYDDFDHRANPLVAEALRSALTAEQATPNVRELGAGERAAYTLLAARQHEARTASATATLEQRLHHALEVGGARLLGYTTTEHGLRVSWERDGQHSVTLVNTELSVVSAGICLSGEDESFDLTSIVDVVREAPAYARWDE